MTETQQLLAEFVANGSESAFRELTTRYFDLVYSTGLRMVDGDSHRAKDVSQIVFSDLARIAPKLSESSMLGGWLHRHTCFVARTLMRGERRREARERLAVAMNALNEEGRSTLLEVAPLLDEAINELGDDDRDAVILRFFERRNLKDVGAALGMSENAAQKRIARAVEELGSLLQRRGVVLTASALAGGLAAEAVTAAPAGLALGVAAAALASGKTAGIGLTSVKAFGAAKTKIAAWAVVLVAGIVIPVLLVVNRTLVTPSGNNQSAIQTDNSSDQNDQPPDNSSLRPVVAADETVRVNLAPQIRAVGAPMVRTPVGATSSTVQSAQVVQAPPGVIAVEQPVRLFSRPGSRMRIEGTSNLHDWRMENQLIQGFMEVGTQFPTAPGSILAPGPVEARVEATVSVKGFRGINLDGTPQNSFMDDGMYSALKADRYPKIAFSLDELSFVETETNSDGKAEKVFSSRGHLAVAGVTNAIAMRVSMVHLDGSHLKVSGRKELSMKSFGVKPPNVVAASTGQSVFKVGDMVTITFDWIIAPRKAGQNLSGKSASSEQLIPAGKISFRNAELRQVLAVYQELAQTKIDIEDKLRNAHKRIQFTNSQPITKQEALDLLDNILLEQADIFVTHPDERHVVMRARK